MTRWTVGIDGSEPSKNALRWTASVGAELGATIEIIGAWHFPHIETPANFDTGFGTPLGPAIEARVAKELEELAYAVNESTGVLIEPITIMGRPASVLLDRADASDLVVVGSRGSGGFRSLVLGSVTHDLTFHSTKPVIVVPRSQTTHELRSVLIGIDGSAQSEYALRWACEFAPGTRSVTAVGIWGGRWRELALPVDIVERGRAEFENSLRVMVDRAKGVRRDVGLEIIDGAHVGRQLAGRATNAGLLVLGASHRGPVQSRLLGSTASYLLHHLPCPTAIVPRPA